MTLTLPTLHLYGEFMNLLPLNARLQLTRTCQRIQRIFKLGFPTCTPLLTDTKLNTLNKRYNIVVGFERPSEWVGWLVALAQLITGRKYPMFVHSFLLVRTITSDRWLYVSLTWEGIQFETINTDTNELVMTDIGLLLPLTGNLERIEENLNILQDMEVLLGKSFRYSPLSFLDNSAWLNCASFVSTILDIGHIDTPSELAEALLNE